ncbi:tyrosine-type recombinase/integrase [Fluviibacter phosphoraccumulans]|uniref:Phage integrase n=2 Tax=Fluviibacter phosphoraccumulans TaxID=1751046 RepID=A0A679I5S1_9RHOO|nr:site-specific integrase [Fluviibacter phosphoraccumulans]BBU69368.1 phage integrase [Fluviibacter phosphoraccumulans]BBU71450.1 phage integrase [Fluviibacter phosphoraccumulans]BCA65304.1 phage integrase [Fluviibacter phosphoraccumulans]
MMGNHKRGLGALAVAGISRRGINFVGDVTGLGLNVTETGSRSWILRYQINGKRKDMGLGGYPSVTLAEAKDRARQARTKIAQGIDPILEAKSARSRLIAEQSQAVTFKEAAALYIKAQRDGWRNAKHAQQWENTIKLYATPKIGSTLVRDLNLTQIMGVLDPIWRTKTETATRLRGRLECIIDWAIVRGYRTGSNPAKWKGCLDKLLPAPNKVAKTAHHKALPYQDAPAFMATLKVHDGIGARALEFAILTATRSGEVRGATWAEFDLDNALWVIPANRMKASKEHRVPLSDSAMAILSSLKATAFCEYVFPSSHKPKSGTAKGKPLSDMTLSAVLRRMNVNAVPHGFRSTFRDWCAETTDYPNEVAEMALAHAVGNKVEAAYRRGDLFDKRKCLMQDWAKYLTNIQEKDGGHE